MITNLKTNKINIPGTFKEALDLINSFASELYKSSKEDKSEKKVRLHISRDSQGRLKIKSDSGYYDKIKSGYSL